MINELKKKILLGTAQFGNNYGITNNKVLTLKEAEEILREAKSLKIDTLDTSEDYNKGAPVVLNAATALAETDRESLRSAVESILDMWVGDRTPADEVLHLIQQAVRDNVADYAFMNK